MSERRDYYTLSILICNPLGSSIDMSSPSTFNSNIVVPLPPPCTAHCIYIYRRKNFQPAQSEASEAEPGASLPKPAAA